MSTSYLQSHLPNLGQPPQPEVLPAQSELAPEAAQAIAAAPDAVIMEAPTEVLFRPTELQCKIKARLHSRFEPTLTVTSVAGMSKAAMIRLTGCSSISDWVKQPGFLTWLINPVYEDEKLEYLLFLSMNALEDILLNADPKAASAKLQAAKLILEMKGRIRTKELTPAQEVDKTEKAVKSMSDDDLAKIINVTKLSAKV